MPSSCAGFVCYTTLHLCQNVTQNDVPGGGTSLSQAQLQHLNKSIFKALELVVTCLQDTKVFQCARAPQLFQTEMCKRETKNRTHTPLSQLPLHRLWDCLCVSPLSSFTVPVSPPSLLPSLPLYSPTFTAPESALVSLARLAPPRTTWNRTPLPPPVLH